MVSCSHWACSCKGFPKKEKTPILRRSNLHFSITPVTGGTGTGRVYLEIWRKDIDLKNSVEMNTSKHLMRAEQLTYKEARRLASALLKATRNFETVRQ